MALPVGALTALYWGVHQNGGGSQSLLPKTRHYELWVAEKTRQTETFAVGPLLLDPAGIELDEQFPPGDARYLLEGHMRMCVLKALIGARDLQGSHEAWLAYLPKD